MVKIRRTFFILITIILGFIGFFGCNSIAVLPPHWEYDLTVFNDASLQLFINQSPYEIVIDIDYDNNHNEISRTIHGFLYDTIFSYERVYFKNNGTVNLTNVVIFSNVSYPDLYITDTVPFLGINETYFISIDRYNWSEFSSIEIHTEQGVYAKIYSVSSKAGSYQTFEFNIFTISFVLLTFISILIGIIFGIQYKRNKKRYFLIILITSIILAFIFLILSYLSGITYLAS